MLSRVNSGCVVGLDGVLIEVEVDVAEKGFPTFTIVGLPDKAVDEAKDRVKTAIVNTNFEMPDSRITVNLAPADIPKEGSAFDLPIAIGILASSSVIKKESLEKSLCVGELSLKGDIRPVTGVISIIMMARKKKIKNIFIPFENIFETYLFQDINIFPVSNLSDFVLHLNGIKLLEKQKNIELKEVVNEIKYDTDFAEIKGQETAKRALEIAASGFHNIHLKGPPGAGKTLLSRAFPSILPLMDIEEIIEVSQIYSAVGQPRIQNNSFIRPFRSPHHTISRIGLIGGGSNPSPGEISLAHRGVLFLDELPEFPRFVLEALRQPMEDGKIAIARANGSVIFPSRFLLLSASNPCPCGYLNHPKKRCSCLPGGILKYHKRLSGPLLDRIDLHVEVPALSEEKLTITNSAENSETIRKRVMKAREIQKKRFINTRILTNGEMSSAQVREFCKMSIDAQNMLKIAIDKFALSARSYFKTIKVGQTIADLAGHNLIESEHISEALQYRFYED